MSFDPLDYFTGGHSNCCGARIMLGDICAECKEHCEAEEDEEREFTPEQLKQTEKAEKGEP